MSKKSIIQRRELEPLMLKANKLIKHYEKAANCCALVLGPEMTSEVFDINFACRECSNQALCTSMHKEAIIKARERGGSYIYLCLKELIYWISPFYSGERVAGAFLSGGIKITEKNSDTIKALAQLMLTCANQISAMSFVQKIVYPLKTQQTMIAHEENEDYEPKHNGENSSIDMERTLLASLRRGDNAEGLKMLKKLLETLYKEVNNKFPAFRLKAIELAVMLSRAVSDPVKIKDNTALETTETYFKKIEKSEVFEDVVNILSSILDRMSGMIFSFHGVRHFSALRKAERYIWTNYTRKLSLKEIAIASGLSAPYFSTVFKKEMGENLSNYLNRLRSEKAAEMLLTTNMPISEIAIACGFEDQSWFSKIFKNNTNLTPGKYREYGSGDINFERKV